MPVPTREEPRRRQSPRWAETVHAQDEVFSDFSFDEADEAVEFTGIAPHSPNRPHSIAEPMVRWVDQQAPYILPHGAGADGYTSNPLRRRPRLEHQNIDTLYRNPNLPLGEPLSPEDPRRRHQEPLPAATSPPLWVAELGAPQRPQDDPLPSAARTRRIRLGTESPRGTRGETSILREINERSAERLARHQIQVRAPPPPPIPSAAVLPPRPAPRTRSVPISEDDKSVIFQHCHPEVRDRVSFGDFLSDQLDQFLSRRRAAAQNRESYLSKKSQNKKKRSHRKANGVEDPDPYVSYRFDTIRPTPSIYLRPGTAFRSDGIMALNVTKYDVPHNTFGGFLQFDDNASMKYWLKSRTGRAKYDLEEEQNTMSFQCSIVDFEETDLRYGNSLVRMPSQYPYHSLGYGTAEYAKDKEASMQSCLVLLQLDKWRNLPPFMGLQRDEMKSLLMCTTCLEVLQRNFVLWKMSFEGRDVPDMIGCLLKATGEMFLVGSEDKRVTVWQYHTSPERPMDQGLMKLEACASRHSGSSVTRL